jgi:O-antigen ligase
MISKIYRKDPNVKARADIYTKTMILIAQKSLVGYGWGSSGEMFGTDKNGTSLNASNIFLETTLSIGAFGGIILMSIFILSIISSVKLLFRANNQKQKTVAIFILIGSVALIMPNFFNAGLFLGFVWLFFGTLDVLYKY